jgi:quinolinate synthase
MAIGVEEIPEEYVEMGDKEVEIRIWEAKERLGPSLLILGHHYQRDSVIKFADQRGDSLKLSQFAASSRTAEYIVFCGVHFMAESADILSRPDQKVILPSMKAGCSLADMVTLEDLEGCWEDLRSLGIEVVPISYINSSAEVKAFCGREGGAVCTSSNAAAVIKWAMEMGKKVLFVPDEHLGRNTGYSLGIGLSEMVTWDPREPLGGLEPQEIARAKLILWKGFCSVHMKFSVEDIIKVRERFPGIKVIVHPECRHEVFRMADEHGSTERIARRVKEGPPGSSFAIGTEINLVKRLADENKDKIVLSLSERAALCPSMYRIDPPHLLWVLDNLLEGRVVNRVMVPEDVAEWARVGLKKMLDIQGG